jgi:hypothetical protein
VAVGARQADSRADRLREVALQADSIGVLGGFLPLRVRALGLLALGPDREIRPAEELVPRIQLELVILIAVGLVEPAT